MPARRDFLIGLIDSISDHFLDLCPEHQSWEDFDPDLDGVRASLQDLLTGEESRLHADGGLTR